MKIWVDDIRPSPKGYIWIQSVDAFKRFIVEAEQHNNIIEVIDIDHDAGAFVGMGGDYIKILDWLEETGRNYPIHIHSMNPAGVENMRRIIQKNGWLEMKRNKI